MSNDDLAFSGIRVHHCAMYICVFDEEQEEELKRTPVLTVKDASLKSEGIVLPMRLCDGATSSIVLRKPGYSPSLVTWTKSTDGSERTRSCPGSQYQIREEDDQTRV